VIIPELILTVPNVDIPVTFKSTVSTFETSISPPLISTVAIVAMPDTTRLESAAPTILTLAIVAIPVTFKLPVQYELHQSLLH
jgi:hypothetical protein